MVGISLQNAGLGVEGFPIYVSNGVDDTADLNNFIFERFTNKEPVFVAGDIILTGSVIFEQSIYTSFTNIFTDGTLVISGFKNVLNIEHRNGELTAINCNGLTLNNISGIAVNLDFCQFILYTNAGTGVNHQFTNVKIRQIRENSNSLYGIGGIVNINNFIGQGTKDSEIRILENSLGNFVTISDVERIRLLNRSRIVNDRITNVNGILLGTEIVADFNTILGTIGGISMQEFGRLSVSRLQQGDVFIQGNNNQVSISGNSLAEANVVGSFNYFYANDFAVANVSGNGNVLFEVNGTGWVDTGSANKIF
jgi:hypothetical protein